MRKIIITSLLIVCLSGVALSQMQQYPDLGLKKIGVKAGPAIPDSPFRVGIAFGITGDIGRLHELLGLETTVEYNRITKKENEIYTRAQSDVCGILTLKILPKAPSIPFQPYIGGGIGFHYYFFTVDENFDQPEPAEYRLELHIAIGATMNLTEGIDGVFTFKINLSDISTYNPYIGVMFDM